MTEYADKFIRDAAFLLATIDPIGTLSIFLGLTAKRSQAVRRAVALRCCLYGAVILLGAVVVGQLILAAMGIRLAAFEIAGSAILFLFGLQMVFGIGLGPANEPEAETEAGHDIAVFPLAVPSIASPGSIMAAVLLTNNDVFPIGVQAVTAGILLGVLLVTYVLLLAANPIHRVIGNNGAAILTRVMGMLLAALAVESLLGGLSKLGT